LFTSCRFAQRSLRLTLPDFNEQLTTLIKIFDFA